MELPSAAAVSADNSPARKPIASTDERHGKISSIVCIFDGPTVACSSLRSSVVWRPEDALDRFSLLGCSCQIICLKPSSLDDDAGNVGVRCLRLEDSERLELRASVWVALSRELGL